MTPRRAVYFWLLRNRGFQSAVQYVMWMLRLDQDIEVATIAKRLGCRDEKVWRIMGDRAMKLKQNHISDFAWACGGAEITFSVERAND